MNCVEFEKHVQRRLDGEPTRDRHEAELHLASCRECWLLDRATEQLIQAMTAPAIPMPPPEMAGRIACRAMETHSRRIAWRRVGRIAVAASVLGVAFAWYQFVWQRDRGPTPTELTIVKQETPPGSNPSLRGNVEDAVGAISGLVNQTAETALEPGKILFPDAASVALLKEATALPRAPVPDVPSLRTAGQNVAHFAPVASFGRFFNYFAQDFPSVDAERKSGS